MECRFCNYGIVGRELQKQELFSMYQSLKLDLSNNWQPVMQREVESAIICRAEW